MDLLDDDEPTPSGNGNAHDYSVSEIAGSVKRVLEGEFGRVRVRGEVGRVMVARTGHMYFDLKDDRAVISAVSWKGQVARMAIRPEEGMEVIATGRLTTFAPQSKYQLQVENVEPAGAGALMAMLEARKAKLGAEGLFDPARKRPLPWLPEVIGVVTSPSGAVIRDILHRLADRFPRRVLIWPVAVQGERCAPEVARAIRGFNALPETGPLPRPDLLIVARGGGSIEDLWGFNEEIVVRAAAECRIPLISAVGHETDTTLIDFASDRRAPTPTAAAEMAVPVRADLMAALADLSARLHRATAQGARQREQRLKDLARALPRPAQLLADPVQKFDRAELRFRGSLTALANRKSMELERAGAALRPALLTHRQQRRQDALEAFGQRLAPALQRGIEQRRARLTEQRLSPAPIRAALGRASTEPNRLLARASLALTSRIARLDDRLTALDKLRQTLGWRETLARGYAVLRDTDGKPLTSASTAKAQTAFTIELQDGAFTAAPLEGPPPPVSEAPRRPPQSKSARSKAAAPDQGSLF